MSLLEKFSLLGKVTIVTGAAMGLGKAMATALAEAGSHIVIADMNLEAARKTAAEIEAMGVTTLPVHVDVTDEDQVNRMVETVINTFGQIDSLFNNAGIALHIPVEEMPYSSWLNMMNVNLNSVFLVSKAVGQVMIRQKKGTIINTSSMSGIIVNMPQAQCAYNTSKAGVIMLTKSLASEWAPHHIRVNTIAPGYMKTELTKPYFEGNSEMVRQWMELTPMKRPGNPDELGGLAVYLASEASSFVTGSVFVVDGGYSVW
ncbi:SDR family NAD(P)-dependent oxidoreductase [Paenibacillus thalictri]|uniref:SDR family oxidoreductase n=1 Tax=Paenibacillus thalictri TaxID=2527873 RepID=A0A4Q9DP08_9BACL|nr:SDR family oxidoreductase [Paenibacillus thalictri]TBL74641.1 SDR family oxidoreductase [Paenibacillus thalictri]